MLGNRIAGKAGIVAVPIKQWPMNRIARRADSPLDKEILDGQFTLAARTVAAAGAGDLAHHRQRHGL
jgi:hypothetical protein